MIIWTPIVLSVLYACVLYICIVPVQRSLACFTWKGALEIRSLLSPSPLMLPANHERSRQRANFGGAQQSRQLGL